MSTRLFTLLILLVSFPFVTGMGAKPEAVAPTVEATPVTKEVIGPANGTPGIAPPHQYGNVIMKRNTGEGQSAIAVIFPHWWHRTQFVCKVCHLDLGFEMKSGTNDIKMEDIFEGKWCGACHNGTDAFAATECDRCHSDGIVVKENRNFYEITKDFPSDGHGNKINWVKAMDEGKFKPKTSLHVDEELTGMDLDIATALKERVMPDVLYPHKPHTQVLGCDNCHPKIFKQEAGANPSTMNNLFGGEKCGVCHGKVAFPFEDCFRCHSFKQVDRPKAEGKD